LTLTLLAFFCLEGLFPLLPCQKLGVASKFFSSSLCCSESGFTPQRGSRGGLPLFFLNDAPRVKILALLLLTPVELFHLRLFSHSRCPFRPCPVREPETADFFFSFRDRCYLLFLREEVERGQSFPVASGSFRGNFFFFPSP